MANDQYTGRRVAVRKAQLNHPPSTLQGGRVLKSPGRNPLHSPTTGRFTPRVINDFALPVRGEKMLELDCPGLVSSHHFQELRDHSDLPVSTPHTHGLEIRIVRAQLDLLHAAVGSQLDHMPAFQGVAAAVFRIGGLA